MLTWQFATPEEYLPLCKLFTESQLGKGYPDIRRRITIPLFLRQVISFYQDSELCGFLTMAYLDAEAEKHMPTTGIHPADWRSGDRFWVVDFAAKKGFDGYKMLRIATRGVGAKKVRYFRKSFKEIREVRAA